MSLLIAFAFLSIFVSFVCSILEAALLSITPSYIAHQKSERPALHERLRHLKENIDQPLAAILTLNTIAHTVGATGVGAQVAIVFGDGYLGIASAVMTLLILLLSEIIPKTVGARYWPTLAPYLPGTLTVMITLFKPFIWLSDQVMKLFGNGKYESNVRQEIKALANLGHEDGALDADEQRVISNILDLHDIKVRQILTPRSVCETVRPEESLSDFADRVRAGQFSRYPVIDKSEEPLGIVFRYDLLDLEGKNTVADVMKPISVVSDQLSAEKLMTRLMEERQHMCLVYDEYGTWLGLITLEDILETIIGQPIVDETDNIPDMRRLARRRWKSRLRSL
jgi:CBS domain containing-hemolysin-like protein